MGATLADGGINPVHQGRVVDRRVGHVALAVMMTAGLYETSGDWLYDIGLPGKSGIGGGIVTVSPGKGGLGTFAPPLDAAGNSVRGQRAAQFLSHGSGWTCSYRNRNNECAKKTGGPAGLTDRNADQAGGRHGHANNVDRRHPRRRARVMDSHDLDCASAR